MLRTVVCSACGIALMAGQQQELDDEYEMAGGMCSDEEGLQALADWRSFSQMYGVRIKEFDAFALNMAKNQAKSSYVRKDVALVSIPSSKYHLLTWKNSPDEIDPMLVKYEGGGKVFLRTKQIIFWLLLDILMFGCFTSVVA